MTVPHQPLDLRADEDRKWRPPDSRLALVDAIRAYALMGLFLLHVEQQFELYWAAPKPSLEHFRGVRTIGWEDIFPACP